MYDRIDQIDAMRMGVDYRFPVKVRSFQIMLRPLSVLETVQVTRTIQEQLLADPKTSSLLQHVTLAKEHLKIASTSDVGTNDPKLTDLILERCTPDELTALHQQYVAGCDRVNPSLEMMTPADLKNLVAELKKNVAQPLELGLALTELSLSQLVSVAQFYLTNGD